MKMASLIGAFVFGFHQPPLFLKKGLKHAIRGHLNPRRQGEKRA